MASKSETKTINVAMKKFRSIKADAKAEGVDLNAILYVGERLTPLQMELTKEFIYSFVELNRSVGRDVADMVVDKVTTEVAIDMLINSLMK